MITEKDIATTLADFDTYCAFVEERKPKLTPARSELAKKECLELDRLLSHPKGFTEPKYLQITYPSINLWFHVSLAAGFFGIEAGKGSSRILVATNRLERFRKLNPFARYLYLFRVFWTKINWDELYIETMDMLNHFFYIQIGMHALKDAVPGEQLYADVENFEECYDRKNPLHRMFVGAGIVIHHLQDFGFWEYERAYIKALNMTERDINVKAITPTRLGVAMIKACLQRPLEVYNPFVDQERVRKLWSEDYNKPVLEKMNRNKPILYKIEPFELAFKDIFPEGSLEEKDDLDADEIGESGEPNVYFFRVSLGRKLWRVIKLSEAHTLQHLHDAIQDTFGLWDVHLFAFFMSGKPWSGEAYWDKRAEKKPVADRAVVGKLGLSVGKKFLYLFDFGDEWCFTVNVERLAHEIAAFKPVIVEGCGDNPEL